MSHRRFSGWEPETTTIYTYDRRGRIISTRSVTEPEWSEEDRGWALALAEVEARGCHGCGQPTSAVWGEDKPRPETAHHLCVACWAFADEHRRVTADRPSVPAAAVKIVGRPPADS